MQYSVAILVGTSSKEFRQLAELMAVWATDTPAIRSIAEEIWAKRAALEKSHLDEPTLYKFDPDSTPESTLIDLLDTVDLHHGEYSHDQPWSVLEVRGVDCTQAIKDALREHGFIDFVSFHDGFTAQKRCDEKGN